MNIGMFTDAYPPQINGVATSVATLKKKLESFGHQVYVFSPTYPGADPTETGIFRIPSLPYKKVGRISMFYLPGLMKIVRKLELDIIHTHTEFSMGIMGRITAARLDVPLVHTMHTLYEKYTGYITPTSHFEPGAKSLARGITLYFCNSAKQVIVPTVKVEKMMRDYGVKRPIAVIPTGIDLDKFNYRYTMEETWKERDLLGIAKDDKVMLHIGRVAEEKNFSELLSLMANYLPSNPDAKLLIVGDGPDKGKFESVSRGLGLERQVIFAGSKPWTRIGLYYQLADILVSASESETQGLIYIEALASGVPVIAKSDACLEGVLQNGVNGYLFSDEAEFIHKVDCILKDARHRDELSRAAIESVGLFTDISFARAMEKTYQNTLNQSARA